MLERAPDAAPRDLVRRPAADRLAAEADLPAVSGSAPEIRVNVVLLPAPLGPMSAEDLAGADLERQSLTATRPPNACARLRTSSSGPVCARAARTGSGGASGTGAARGARQQRARSTATPVARELQESTIRIRTRHLEIALPPEQPGQHVLQHCFSSVISVAPTTAPHTLPRRPRPP